MKWIDRISFVVFIVSMCYVAVGTVCFIVVVVMSAITGEVLTGWGNMAGVISELLLLEFPVVIMSALVGLLNNAVLKAKR